MDIIDIMVNIIYACNLCRQEFLDKNKHQIKRHEEWHSKPLYSHRENRIVGNVVWNKRTE